MKLPAMADLLMRVIGRDAALRMMAAAAYGGKSFEVPKGDLGRGEQAFAALAEVIGNDGALALCRHFGGDRIYVPRCDVLDLVKRNREIVQKYNAGVTVWQLASDYVLSDRQIWTILKKTDMNESLPEPQTSLF